MWRRDAFSWGFFAALGAAALAVLVYSGWQVFRAALNISTPFIVGLAFALLLDPLVDRIQDRWAGGRRLPAVSFVFVVFLAAFVGLIAFIIPMLIGQTQSLVTWFTPTTYTVLRSESPNRGFAAVESGLIDTRYEARDLTNGVPYYFKVVAVDSKGQKRQIGAVARAVPDGPELGPSSATQPQAAGAAAVTTTTTETSPGASPAPSASPSPSPAEPGARPGAGRADTGGPSPEPAPPARTPRPAPVPAPRAAPAPAAERARPYEAPSPAPSAGGESGAPQGGAASPEPSASPESVGIAAPPPPPARTGSLFFDGDGAARAAEPTPSPSGPADAAGGDAPLPLASPSYAPSAGAGNAKTVTRRVVTTTTTTRPAAGHGSPRGAGAAAPAEPTSAVPLVAAAGDGSATLTWKAPTRDVSGIDSVRVQLDRWLAAHRKIGPFALPANFESVAAQYNDRVTQALKVSATRVGEIILASASGLLTVILIPIVTFYVLSDIDRLRGRLMYLLPERVRGAVQNGAIDVGNVFGSYVRGMLLVMLLYGLTAMVLFVGFLKSYALLLGVAAGILYAVPYVGALATALLAAILSLITGHGMGGTLLILVVQLAENQVFDNVIVPRVIGKSVGLHPLLTLFALLLGGSLFGLWGMLLSVPVAASIQQILFRRYPKLASPTPLAVMMDTGSSPRKPGERGTAPEPGPPTPAA